MHHSKVTIIKAYIEKMHKTLNEADFSIRGEMENLAFNRLYYALFYCISALAIDEEFETSKHQQLMGWFNKTFIHERKLFKKSFSKIYKEIYEARWDFDYNILEPPTDLNIQELNRNVRNIITEITNYLNSKHAL